MANSSHQATNQSASSAKGGPSFQKDISLSEALRERRSSRALSDRPVERQAIIELIEAARWAPSSGNLQPWRFLIVRKPARLKLLHEAFARGNAWAQKAPILVVVCANPTDDHIRDEKPYFLFDCGLAVENLILRATSLGLVAHPTIGWDEGIVKRNLDIPDPVRVVTIVVVAHPGNVEEMDEDLQRREKSPRVRKSLEEIACWDDWTLPITLPEH